MQLRSVCRELHRTCSVDVWSAFVLHLLQTTKMLSPKGIWWLYVKTVRCFRSFPVVPGVKQNLIKKSSKTAKGKMGSPLFPVVGGYWKPKTCLPCCQRRIDGFSVLKPDGNRRIMSNHVESCKVLFCPKEMINGGWRFQKPAKELIAGFRWM